MKIEKHYGIVCLYHISNTSYFVYLFVFVLLGLVYLIASHTLLYPRNINTYNKEHSESADLRRALFEEREKV